jgi:hypothetical protein
MSSAEAVADPPSNEHVSLEGRLFRNSPLGVLGTSALIFVIAAGGFLLISAVVDYPLITKAGVVLDHAVPGLVGPLLLATALGMNRYADMKQRAEVGAFAQILSTRSPAIEALLAPPSSEHRALASLIGAAAGVVVASVSMPQIVLRAYPAVYGWQFALITVLCTLFMRGAVQTSRTWRNLHYIIEHALRIDLLHADKLSVIGRQTARQALVWFTTAAVVCLYFVGGDRGLTTIPILILCTGLGLWIFLRPMAGVHRRVQAAKTAELERVRDEIARAGRDEATDPQAAARLPGLIAYEARIHAVPEWPFDQSTLIRVATYVLIPAVPWFGEAIVSEMLQRLAH